MKAFLSNILFKLNYEIELITQLVTIILCAMTYGFIESWYIPTDAGTFTTLPWIFHQWSYYHLFMCFLLGVVSFSLAISHVQWLASHKKKYILLMCTANMFLSLMLEDIAWFLARWKSIAYNEWTMMFPYAGVPLYFTWIPAWYIIVICIAVSLYYLASKYANEGYSEHLKTIKV